MKIKVKANQEKIHVNPQKKQSAWIGWVAILLGALALTSTTYFNKEKIKEKVETIYVDLQE
jgi:hypothetical protein